MIVFAERLKTLRTENNLSQTQLAYQLKISQSAIARWEKGEQLPNIEFVKEIAIFFNVTIDYLAGLEN